MSRSAARFDPDELPLPICDTCGGEIEKVDQDCPALTEAVCSP
jgi:hypothetical protein